MMPDTEETDMDTEHPDAESLPMDEASLTPEEAGAEMSSAFEAAADSDISAEENAAMAETAPMPVEPDPPTEDGSGTAPDQRPAAKPAATRHKANASAPAAKTSPVPDTPTSIRRTAPSSILTLSADTEVETQESRKIPSGMKCRTLTAPAES